uniref:Uncharacterized protein n=1 Tax=Anguilla anguilla TaxID=7936 RepID=A0A0E9QRR7_ANGAN
MIRAGRSEEHEDFRPPCITFFFLAAAKKERFILAH